MTIVAPPPIALPPHPSDPGASASSTNPHLQSPNSTIGFFPTPSPAACGKRKHAELTAAAMLATVGTGQKGEGGRRKSLSQSMTDGMKQTALALSLEGDGPNNTVEDYFKNNGVRVTKAKKLNRTAPIESR